MKKSLIAGIILSVSILIFSCGNDSTKDCEKNNTGTVMIHNDGDFMPSGNADFYLGNTKIASVAKGSEATVDNIPIGLFKVTVKVGVDTIYEEDASHFTLDTVKQCLILHYSTDRWNPLSDKRLKKNILPLHNALADIGKLNLYTYEYNAPKNYTGFLPKGLHYGFIAQELKEVYPTFVQLNSNNYFSVNYQEMIPILVKGIQEQQAQIDELKKEMADLKSLVKNQQALSLK